VPGFNPNNYDDTTPSFVARPGLGSPTAWLGFGARRSADLAFVERVPRRYHDDHGSTAKSSTCGPPNPTDLHRLSAYRPAVTATASCWASASATPNPSRPTGSPSQPGRLTSTHSINAVGWPGDRLILSRSRPREVRLAADRRWNPPPIWWFSRPHTADRVNSSA